ncbi:MAG: malate dehydrogenase [Alphaproteobacteria bacterium]|nr:malate dehydrogenase [Alphaproteobacteria bacterium]
MAARVIGSEHITDAAQRGRRTIEILPGDIVTPTARESAERLRVRLVDGPLERPVAIEADGATAARRSLYRRNPKWTSPRPHSARSNSKISRLALVGAGGVGTAVAHLAASQNIASEIALIDVVPGLAESISLDLSHASGITGSQATITGGTSLSLVADAQVVVVTAGRPRTPGMSRADLLQINRRVVRQVAEAVRTSAPNAVVIVVTNPLDEMTVEMLRATQFPRNQVLGMAGTLDSSRFRQALAEAAGVAAADVDAMTLGSHGDEMAPIVSRARIRGRPLTDYLNADAIQACVQNAITGGGQVVALRKTGSAALAPAHAIVEMIDHMRGARAGLVPVSIMMEGEYGIEDVVLGVPCRLGLTGMLEVVDIPLEDSEREKLQAAALAIRARLAD